MDEMGSAAELCLRVIRWVARRYSMQGNVNRDSMLTGYTRYRGGLFAWKDCLLYNSSWLHGEYESDMCIMMPFS